MRFLKGAIVFLLCLSAGSCAEFRNRGGAIDWLEDKLIFKADTKQMRLLRSYILVAGLARVAGKAPVSMEERFEIASKIRTATMNVDLAYRCAIRDERGCAFFDDRMASLDLTILRLARATFIPEENKDLLALVKKGMGSDGGGLDGLFDVLDSGGRIIDGGGQLLTQSGQALNVVGAIMRLASNSIKVGGRLTPIYRDAIELEMQVAIDYLKKICPANREENCAADINALENIYANGAGDFKSWRSAAGGIFEKYRKNIKPEPAHFQQVTELLYLACAGLVGAPNEHTDSCFPAISSDPKTSKFHPDLQFDEAKLAAVQGQ